jgi:AraC-like DNA-binding protein
MAAAGARKTIGRANTTTDNFNVIEPGPPRAAASYDRRARPAARTGIAVIAAVDLAGEIPRSAWIGSEVKFLVVARHDIGPSRGRERRIPEFAESTGGREPLPISLAGQAATIRYATDDLPRRDRIPVRSELISDLLTAIELKPDHPPSQAESEIVARALHDLQLLKVTFTAAQLVRGASHGGDSGYFLMHVNFDGVVTVSSLGRQLTLNQGDAVLLDGAHPFAIHRQETGSSYVVRIPRGRMAQLVFLAEAVVMRRLPRAAGLSRLLTAYMDAVLLHADRAPPRAHQLTHRHVSDLLALLLEPGDPATAGEADSAGIVPDQNRGLSDLRFQAARSFIVEHAHDQIAIRQVADHLGITERHVQRLFENHRTTFTAFLNDVRLARAHAMLCDRGNDRLRIRLICFKIGFRDVSHFNRVFRARYGCTPAEVRKTRGGAAPPL